MLYYNQSFPDSGTLTGWYAEQRYEIAEKNYKAHKALKVPLILASIIEKDALFYEPILEKEGWKWVCWYPSCHGRMTGTGSYNMRLYAKEQKDAPLDRLTKSTKVFPLSCSTVTWNEFSTTGNPYNPTTGLLGYPHGVIGIRRVLLNNKIDETKVYQWRKFAATELATYWFWGLTPEEDLWTLEPEGKGRGR